MRIGLSSAGEMQYHQRLMRVTRMADVIGAWHAGALAEMTDCQSPLDRDFRILCSQARRGR